MRRARRLLALLASTLIIVVLPDFVLLAQQNAPAQPNAGAAAQPAAPAAETKPAEGEKAAPAVAIADEPKTVDPATVVPAPLAQLATVAFSETSLKDVVKWLQDDQKVGVLIDSKALADGRVLLSEPVTDQLKNEPLYLLLNRLRTIGVTWYQHRGMLHLTTLGAASEHMPTTPYIIGDLLDAGYDSTSLVEAIRAGVGGPWLSEGEVQGGSLMLLGDVVFLMHTDEKHREAAGLLAALRKHGRRTFTLDAPQHAALRAKLEQPVNVAFQELPLETAVAELAKLTQIDVRLDRPSLRAAGVRERSPVTLELADQTLETVLRGLLADLNLTWVLRDGALWIASRDDAARFHKAAVYDVRDLCRDENDSEALRQALMGQTRGPWDEGEQPQEADANAAPSKPGTIAFPRAGVMIVRHTESVHDDVLQLLENYRLALKASKPRQTPGVDPKEVIVRYYRLPATIAEALVPLLPTLTAPETWKAADRPEAPGAILHSLPSRSSLLAAKGHEVVGENAESSGAAAIVVNNVVIGIRQSREVHEQIADLLDRIESGDARHLPEYTTGYGMGGGMGGMGGGGMGGGGGFFSVPLKPAVVVPKR